MCNNYYNPYMGCQYCELWRQYYDSYMMNRFSSSLNYFNQSGQSRNKQVISISPLPNWKIWKQHVEKLGGHWAEEGCEIWEHILEETKNATNILGGINKKFKPCMPPQGYGCIEYKVMENFPVFGALPQDIVVRICYPRRIVSDVQYVLPNWLHDCLKKAAEDAEKAFVAAVVLTAWGAFVASIEAGIHASINTFNNSLRKSLSTPPENVKIDMKEIIPCVYMRHHSLYIPHGNSCFPMYHNYGHSS